MIRKSQEEGALSDSAVRSISWSSSKVVSVVMMSLGTQYGGQVGINLFLVWELGVEPEKYLKVWNSSLVERKKLGRR